MTQGWRLAAVRIGRSVDRRAGLLVGGDDIDQRVELAYYLWCARDEDGGVVVVDAGFSADAARLRTIVGYRSPASALRDVGIDAASVGTVVLTHLHWDHMGGFDEFPNATFVVGRSEWEWTMSRLAGGGRMFDETYDTAALARLAALPRERVRLLGSAATIGPVTAEVVGGHTPGHVVVRAQTRAGTALLLGDLAYLYGNLSRDSAPMICFDRWRTVDLYRAYAASPVIAYPGHDPAVLDRMDHRLGDGAAVSE